MIFFGTPMQHIDIEDILYRRTGRHLPAAAASLLRRLIHERELNEILDGGVSLPPKEFIDHVLKYIGIEYSVVRTADIPAGDRYIFAANHPFGGPDGMIVARTLADEFGDIGVIVNDMLSNIGPLRPLWIPVNKYGRQNEATQLAYDEALASPAKQIFTFPAGFCSRIIGGRVADTEWKVRFVRDARRYDRRIVPVYVDGRLSNRFYAIYLLRRALHIDTNIELALLADEMFRQRGKRIRIIFGAPVDIRSDGRSDREIADSIRDSVYSLPKLLKHKR